MELSCPRCEQTHRVPPGKLDRPVRVATCSECGAALVFLKRPAADEGEKASRDGPPPGAGSGGAARSAPRSGSRASAPGRLEKLRSRDRFVAWGAGVFLLAVLLGVGGLILSTVRSSAAYQAGLAFVEENEKIQRLVGRDMEFGWFPEGEIQGDEAAFRYEVSGTRGEAEVGVALVRTDGGWVPVEAAYASGGQSGSLDLPGVPEEARSDAGDLPSLQRAWELVEDGRGEEALSLIDRRVELDPRDAEAHYWRGRILLRMERPDEAVGAFREAVRLRPDYPSAQRNLGYALGVTGRHEEAVRALDEAVRLDGSDGWTFYNRGRWHYELGNRRQAVEDALRSCELEYEAGCDVYRELTGESP